MLSLFVSYLQQVPVDVGLILVFVLSFQLLSGWSNLP